MTDPTGTYQPKLAAVHWLEIDDELAQALYQLTVVACRGTRGACFCGCHVTLINDGPAFNCACARLGVPAGKRCGQCGRKGEAP